MIKITTDSTCDLPAWVLEQHHITVTPLGVVKGGRLYQDGIDIRTADIKAHVDAGGDITTTNAVNVADYEAVFRDAMEQYDAVIHFNIGSGFSCCCQNAKLAAEEVPEVYVVDTGNLTVGHGLIVLAAAEAAEAGRSVSEILAMAEDMVSRIETSFVLDRLDYMKKGGRCSAVTALGANLLKLHPCLEVIDGKLSVVKKYRGSMEKVYRQYITERLAGKSVVEDWAFITHSGEVSEQTLQELTKLVKTLAPFKEVFVTQAGCTVSSHCGPGTLGVLFLRAD